MAARRRAGLPSPKTSWRLRSNSVSMISDMIVFLFEAPGRERRPLRLARRGPGALRMHQPTCGVSAWPASDRFHVCARPVGETRESARDEGAGRRNVALTLGTEVRLLCKVLE